jgi:glucans biosynthesis protein C
VSVIRGIPRRHDLDWLRAGAILALLFFHSAMPFAAESEWHIRNRDTSVLLHEANFFLSRFRMALLFLIAGVATQFVLRTRSPAQYLRDRCARLLVPLVFGVFVVVPPQIYVERVATGAFHGSYLAFWPRVLNFTLYPAGEVSYHHLWFVFYLFLYSAMLLPLLGVSRSIRGARWLAWTRARVAQHGVHWLALPMVITYTSLVQRFDGLQDVVHDGAMFLTYFGYFVTGWFIGIDEALWARIREGRRRSFTVALSAFLVICGLRWGGHEPPVGYSALRLLYLALLGCNAWAWVLTLLGYSARWLNRDHAVLRWVREASYPFYILHQTVIVLIAFFVVRTDEPVLEKFLFTATVSLLVTLGLYEVFVRPYEPIRWLFGMASAPRRSRTAPLVPVAQEFSSDAARAANRGATQLPAWSSRSGFLGMTALGLAIMAAGLRATG